MKPITFIIRGEPVAKGRGRMTIVNGKPRQYTPKKTRTWEQHAAVCAAEAMEDYPPVECAVRLTITASFPIPASWPKWKKELALAGEVHHTSRPDEDNISKAVKDALTMAGVWKDDAQVDMCCCEKRYSDLPAVHIYISPQHGVNTQTKTKPLPSAIDTGDSLVQP